MVKLLIYSLVYSALYLLPISVVIKFDLPEYYILICLLADFIFAFVFKPNCLKILLAWFLIQLITFVDVHFHLYIVLSHHAFDPIADFSLFVIAVSIFQVSPLILSWAFYATARKFKAYQGKNIMLNKE